MRLVLLSLFLVGCVAGCVDDVAARWELDHDHVVAARALPPRVAPGETTTLDALVAHAGGPTTIAEPTEAVMVANAGLGGILTRDGSHWIVTAPAEEALATARTTLGLAAGAPVPIDLAMAFARDDGDPMYVKKTVWLGEHGENPEMPLTLVDDQPMPETLDLPLARDIYVEVRSEGRVSWFTSCGELFQDDVARAFVRIPDACDGELAVAVRDDAGGVVWRVWPLHAR